jgi:hypothetical protein
MVRKVILAVLLLTFVLPLISCREGLKRGSRVCLVIKADPAVAKYKKIILEFLKEELVAFECKPIKVPYKTTEIQGVEPRASLFKRAADEYKVAYLVVIRVRDEGVGNELTLEINIISVKENKCLHRWRYRLPTDTTEALSGKLCRLVREELRPREEIK